MDDMFKHIDKVIDVENCEAELILGIDRLPGLSKESAFPYLVHLITQMEYPG
jgi:hypothetical protein